MDGYRVELVESEGLTAKQKIAIKNFDNATRLDEATAGGNTVVIHPVAYAHVHVINEYSKNEKEYDKYIFVDDTENMYVTGSVPAYNSFMDIWSDRQELDESGEEWDIQFYAEQSKNQPGEFISCRII